MGTTMSKNRQWITSFVTTVWSLLQGGKEPGVCLNSVMYVILRSWFVISRMFAYAKPMYAFGEHS
jgi:hypothetical protein